MNKVNFSDTVILDTNGVSCLDTTLWQWKLKCAFGFSVTSETGNSNELFQKKYLAKVIDVGSEKVEKIANK